jgi:hypothetical protein
VASIGGAENDPDRIRAWQERLNDFGPRLTGNAAHRAFLDFLRAELALFGMEVREDRLTFTRWEAKTWALDIVDPDGTVTPLPVTSPYPYSGRTGPEGITGEAVYYRTRPWSWRRARGKIAVVDVRMPALPRAVLALALRPRDGSLGSHGFPSRFRSPLLSLVRPPDLKAAAEAGVRAVVCVWRGCSQDNAADQYLPFTTPLRDCPALWVGASTGDRLREIARRGGRLRLRLEAEIVPDTPTQTLYCVLPGMDDREAVIVNTHTDGPNACEENGAVGLLALARHFAGLPREQRRRTLVFVFVSGHFQLPQLGSGGQATRTWLRTHPELWDGKSGHMKAVAGVTLEHLGAMEWRDDEAGAVHRPTGRPEFEWVSASNVALHGIYAAALAGRTMTRSIVIKPMSDIYFGEGQPMFQAGIPTLSLIALPDYLCAASAAVSARLNPELLVEQIETFRKAIEAIDATPAADLLQREAEPGAWLQRLVRLTGMAHFKAE